MTASEAIEKVTAAAKGEIGYLEKASNSSLYDKTANAGSGNYTKYWAEIKPSFQALPWCACFVTWCFVQAFGRDYAELLLRHYPYVYCPQMQSLFTLNANPKKGDIVIFKRSGTFTHTGLVTSVKGDYFTTVEGNTSGASGIVANGGGVCAKGYYNSSLPGTKFCSPDYSILENNEEELTVTQYEELKELAQTQAQELADLKAKVAQRTGYYNYIDDNMPESYKPTIKKLVGAGMLNGDDNGNLMLTIDMMRILTVLDRAGALG
ncbi:MAG: CHAP domain-containing protein [Candidatus Ornithomonoglobus sp.]